MRIASFFFVLVLLLGILAVTAFAADGSGGGHWWEAFSWFGDVANFIKSLIVPPENYWHNRLAKLNSLVNAKFSGLGQLYRTLDQFFRVLADPAPAQLKVSIPDNFFYQGYRGISVDFFAAAAPYIRFLWSVLSGSCFLITVIVCYHKVRTFFTEEG